MANSGKKTQGLGTFYTAPAPDSFNFEDNPTDIDFGEYLIILLKNLALKVPYSSDFYVRVVDNLEDLTELDYTRWNLGDIVFDKKKLKFYQLRTSSSLENPIWDEIATGGGGTTVIANPREPEATDPDMKTLQVGSVIYKFSAGATLNEYIVKAEKISTKNKDHIELTGKSLTGDYIVDFDTPKVYVKESSVTGKVLSITNVLSDGTENIIGYGIGASELALQKDLEKEIVDREAADKLKVDVSYTDTKGITNQVLTGEGQDGIVLYTTTVEDTATLTPAYKIGICTNGTPNTTSGLLAEIYALEKDNNTGTRFIATKDKMYYTKGKNDLSYDSVKDEIATVDYVNSMQTALEAGDNIKIEVGSTATSKKISSTAIDDTTSATDTTKGYSHKEINTKLANKTDYLIDNPGKGKAYVFNEKDGGGLLFTGDNKVNSFVGVNEGGNTAKGIGAQVYVKSTTDNKGMRVNFTKLGAYYTKDKTDSSFVDNDEIATIGNIETEKTRAEGVEVTLTTNLENEVTRAKSAENDITTDLTTNYYKKTATDTLLAAKANSADVYDKTDTYSKTEVNTELAKKANDFDIDTNTLAWDLTATLRKLKTKLPDLLILKGTKDKKEDLPTSGSVKGEVYLVGTGSTRDYYVNIPSDATPTTPNWIQIGDTSVDLTIYLTKTDAAATYQKIGDCYLKTETLSTAEINTELAKKQDKLVSQVNIASVGASLMSQVSLVDNNQILFTIDGGDLSSSADKIDVVITAVNCTFSGGMTSYHQRITKTTLTPPILKFVPDDGKALPDTVVSELDGTPLVLYTDYTWNKTTGVLQYLQPGIDKGKAAGAKEYILKVAGE